MKFLLVASLLACSSPAFADLLWAVDNTTLFSSQTSHLWTIDTMTGAATQGVALSQLVTGDITMLDGTLYAAISGGFGSIDPVTGVVTPISIPHQPDGFAANPNMSVLYGDGSTGGHFNIITPDGSDTLIGGSGPNDFIHDLAYDPLDDVLYGWDFNDDHLGTVNTTTGNLTEVASKTFTSNRALGDIGFDSENQTLYLLSSAGVPGTGVGINLYSLDVTTGAATLIGATGLTTPTADRDSGVTFVGLADQPAPEPSSFILIAMGLAGFALVRFRRASSR